MYHYASSSFPGIPLEQSVAMIKHMKVDSKRAFLKNNQPHSDFHHKIQLCPQHKEYLSPETIELLKEKYPQTEFYLHANVKVFPSLFIKDASNLIHGDKSFLIEQNMMYFKQLNTVNKKLNHQYYTLHAGYQKNSNHEDMMKNLYALEALMKVEVFVEGLYPAQDNYLMATLDEYEWVAIRHGFVLDLSHLNIVFHKEKKEIDLKWIKDMMLHENCREIHISENDGSRDQHLPIKKDSIVLNIFNDLSFMQEVQKRIQQNKLTIFSEENFSKK